MSDNIGTPNIRFKDFKEMWRISSLDKVTEITMGQSPNGENYTNNSDDHILVQGNADMKNGEVIPRVWTTQITKTADIGDLIITVRAPVGEIGRTAYPVVIGRGVAAIKGNEFILQTLKHMNNSGYWKKYSAGSTFDSINSNDLCSAIIAITNHDEEVKIGKFLNKIDQLIDQKQKKYNKIVNLKKALIKKMFPKYEESKPQIRFKGFNSYWKTDELGRLTDIFDGTHQTPNYTENGIEFLSVENIKTLKSEKYISREDFLKEFKVFPKKGDILMTRIGDIGTANIVDTDDEKAYYVSLALIKNDKFDSYFLRENIHSDFVQKELWNRTLHIAFPKKINKNEIGKVLVNYPEEKTEQVKIGKLFNHMERLIELQKVEIEKLKNIKNAFLERMLV